MALQRATVEHEEDVADLPSTAKFKGKTSSSGHVIVRDHGHSGMTLSSFCEHAMAKAGRRAADRHKKERVEAAAAVERAAKDAAAAAAAKVAAADARRADTPACCRTGTKPR